MSGTRAIMTGRTESTGSAPVPRVPLLDPEDGSPLERDSPHSLRGAGPGRWPIVAGIPFLRTGREALRRDALAALDAGEGRAALIMLLADQDDYARTPPPDATALSRLVAAVDDGSASLRDAMAALGLGPVADYFAHRWSAPTYLSGLALLERHWSEGAAVVEVACGLGHFLRDLALRGVPALGVDVVFAKLWLARRLVVPPAVGLVCGDAAAGLPLGRAARLTLAFCHDAFYFLADKPRVVAGLQRLVGDPGRILIGHAHNSDFDHRGVAGEPRTPAEYSALLPGCRLYDDAELARSAWAGEAAGARLPSGLAGVEAVAIVWDPPGRPAAVMERGPGLDRPRPGAVLRLNPILADDEGLLRPRWPSTRFEAEYAAESPYLSGEPTPRIPLPHRVAASGEVEAEVGRLARRRILLDLPERW